MHEKLHGLLDTWPIRLQLSIRFVDVKNIDKRINDPRSKLFNYWLQQIYGTENSSYKTKMLIQDWFEKESIDAFMKKYNFEEVEHQELVDLMTSHDKWVKKTGIIKTPTLFLNGYEFPKSYSLNDLVLILPGIVDYFQNKNEFIKSRCKKNIEDIV